MERWKRIQALMEAKRRGMEAHERYLNQARSYAPGEELYMREMHFVMAVGPSQSPTMSEIAKRLDVTHGAVSQIAARLEMAEATTKTHVSRILAKLRLRNRVQAAILAQDLGLTI